MTGYRTDPSTDREPVHVPLSGGNIEYGRQSPSKTGRQITFVEGEIFTLFRQVENTIDLELDKSGGYNIQILSAGRLISVTVNGGGENEIVINQSD